MPDNFMDKVEAVLNDQLPATVLSDTEMLLLQELVFDAIAAKTADFQQHETYQ